MSATRLSDSQKTELVNGFKAGVGTQVLAVRFGCSANTVTRVARAAIGSVSYERLKRQRLRAGPEVTQVELLVPAIDQASATLDPEPAPAEQSTQAPAPSSALNTSSKIDTSSEIDTSSDAEVEVELAAERIDDEFDYGEEDEDLIDVDAISEEDPDFEAEPDCFLPIAVLGFTAEPQQGEPIELRALASAQLPASVYMLVDKTVELQARPLSDIAELGQLPPDEQTRQALVVFSNPRQAKRLCGRTQRVIKLPDTRVIERTAPYLLAQGISRVVIEGALYALPGS